MDLEALSKRFFVRALETEDVDIIYDYFLLGTL